MKNITFKKLKDKKFGELPRGSAGKESGIFTAVAPVTAMVCLIPDLGTSKYCVHGQKKICAYIVFIEEYIFIKSVLLRLMYIYR